MAVTGQSIGIIRMSAAADAVTGKMKIDYIRWVGGTTAGHQCILKDTDGNTLFDSVADGAHFVDVHAIPMIVDGIDLDTLDSGILYIYLNPVIKAQRQ